MSDLLSNIYLGYSLVWYHHHFKNNELKDICLNYLNNEIEYKMNLIIDNYPIDILKPLLIPLKNSINYSNLENKNKFYSKIINDTNLYNKLKEDIYYDNTVLEKMEKLRTIDTKNPEYDKLYQDIINVGEFNIENNSDNTNNTNNTNNNTNNTNNNTNNTNNNCNILEFLNKVKVK
jgi:hypothetical protein